MKLMKAWQHSKQQMLHKSKASAAHDKLGFEGAEEVLIKEPGYVYIYLTCLPEPLGRMSINYSP
jgi:hypothetical protein